MFAIEDVETVGVVGAGTMGSGIAQTAATAGYEVRMYDVDEEALAEGGEHVRRGLEKLVDRGDLTADEAETAVDRVSLVEDLSRLSACEVVVEAVVEDIEVKQSVFSRLDGASPADTVLATNTSTLSVTRIASATERPANVVGMHFMNPVPLMPGVEVVVGERTAPEAVELVHDFAAELGKETWEADDRPGFVVNRILMPWINEGIRAVDEGVSEKGDVDRAMRLGTNVPMGPLELADHIGLDVCLEASRTLHDELGERFRPAALLRRKVDAEKLGKKTGEGFYVYDEDR